MKAGLIGLLAAGAIGFCLPVSASVILLPLNFAAPAQSMWGGGVTADFGATGEASLGSVAGVNIGFDYGFGANTGTVSAKFQGGISVDYTPSFDYGDPASIINLKFVGNTGGGQLKSDFGAWAQVNILGFSVLDRDYELNIDQSFTPQLGQRIAGSDTITLGNAGVNIGVGSAGVNFNIEQTDKLDIGSISGLLVASQEGSSTSLIKKPFTLHGVSNVNLGPRFE